MLAQEPCCHTPPHLCGNDDVCPIIGIHTSAFRLRIPVKYDRVAVVDTWELDAVLLFCAACPFQTNIFTPTTIPSSTLTLHLHHLHFNSTNRLMQPNTLVPDGIRLNLCGVWQGEAVFHGVRLGPNWSLYIAPQKGLIVLRWSSAHDERYMCQDEGHGKRPSLAPQDGHLGEAARTLQASRINAQPGTMGYIPSIKNIAVHCTSCMDPTQMWKGGFGLGSDSILFENPSFEPGPTSKQEQARYAAKVQTRSYTMLH